MCALLGEADVCWQGRQGLQGYDQKSFVKVSELLDSEAKCVFMLETSRMNRVFVCVAEDSNYNL